MIWFALWWTLGIIGCLLGAKCMHVQIGRWELFEVTFFGALFGPIALLYYAVEYFSFRRGP